MSTGNLRRYGVSLGHPELIAAPSPEPAAPASVEVAISQDALIIQQTGTTTAVDSAVVLDASGAALSDEYECHRRSRIP